MDYDFPETVENFIISTDNGDIMLICVMVISHLPQI